MQACIRVAIQGDLQAYGHHKFASILEAVKTRNCKLRLVADEADFQPAPVPTLLDASVALHTKA
jgi:hypothetical protein